MLNCVFDSRYLTSAIATCTIYAFSMRSHGRPKRTPTTMRVDVDALHDHAAFCNMLEQYLPQFGPSTKHAIVNVFMSRFVLRQKQQCVPDTTTPNADQSKCKTFAWKRLDGRVARGIISRALTEAQEDWALAEATAKMLCGIMPMQSPRHDKYETYNDSGRDSPSDTPNKNAELENQLERAGRRLERRQPGPGRNKCGDIDGRQLVPPPPLSVSSHQKRKAGVCDWDEFGSGRKDEEEECTCEVTKRRPKTRAKTKQWSSSSSSAGAVVALRNVSPDLDIALPGVNGTSGSQTQQAATAVGRDHDHAPKKIDMNEIIVV
jgi:hypothetical protein